MEYKVKVIIKEDEVTDNEKSDRIKQFQQSFVAAAADYYSGKAKEKAKGKQKKAKGNKKSA